MITAITQSHHTYQADQTDHAVISSPKLVSGTLGSWEAGKLFNAWTGKLVGSSSAFFLEFARRGSDIAGWPEVA